MRLILAGLLLVACGERHVASTTPGPDPIGIDDLDDLPGEPCGSALRVVITRADTTTFCIDRFEASLDGGDRGAAHQALGDDTSGSTDGSTDAVALLQLGRKPATQVSWYQAKAACENAGKELCSADDWERACRGPDGLSYPYGNQADEQACVGFFAYPDDAPANTGSRKTCGSDFGVYDMSGNLEEWTMTAVPRVNGTVTPNDRAVRGGGFRSNAAALACAGPEFHEAPGSQDTDRGFRCCSPGPI